MSANPVVALRRLEISILADNPRAAGASVEPAFGPLDFRLTCGNGTWRADLRLRRSSDRALLSEAIATGSLACVVGDADEVAALQPSSPAANACLIRLDLKNSTIRVSTSLTGLPPLFVFRNGLELTLSSPFLPESARGALAPDFDGVADTLRWGHPLDGRTLFANVRIARSHSTVLVAADGTIEVGSSAPWPGLQDLAFLSREEIIRAQITAFAEAAGRIRTDNAFMSLSGGLDSRTSLVALLSHGHPLPCVTMAGSPQSLDVRLAKAFCDAYGLEHRAVLLGEEFYRRCPELLVRSAELTGGVSCLSQTVDLFLYESMPASFTTRISGNLGNQVGRGGVESLSAYQPNPDIFSGAIRERLLARPLAPWFIPRITSENYGETIFGQEVHYWSIANYVAGSSSAYQLTPYADFRLMQLARAAFARDRELLHPTWKKLRARDLRHRFAGTPRSRSFQRQFLIQHDRKARHVPLNWGWRAGGGWSVGWGMTAMASAADAALTKLNSRSRLLGPTASWLSAKLDHRSALVDWRRVIRTRLRELALDTFTTRQVRQSGLFDPPTLDRVLSQHFSGNVDHQFTVSRALEIGLGLSVRQSSPGNRPR